MNITTIAQRRAEGARIRKEVLGSTHVKAVDESNVFDMAFQEFTEDQCWGSVWTRDGLSRHTRSLLNLAMLSSMGRWHEFEVHVRGAANNGVTDREIVEVMYQAGVYAGIPVAAEGMRRAKAVLAEYRKTAAASRAPD